MSKVKYKTLIKKGTEFNPNNLILREGNCEYTEWSKYYNYSLEELDSLINYQQINIWEKEEELELLEKDNKLI
jgi:hypothetical protein